MRRLLICLVVLGTLMSASPARAHDNHRIGKPGRGPCAIEWNYRPHSSHLSRIKAAVRDIIACATDRWDVYGGYTKALRIAECESSLYPWAHSPSGQHLGIFQLSLGVYQAGRTNHWDDWFPAPGDPGRYNARANVLSAIHYAHSHGWGAWSCQ